MVLLTFDPQPLPVEHLQPAGYIADAYPRRLPQLDLLQAFGAHSRSVVLHGKTHALLQALNADIHPAALRQLSDAVADCVFHQGLQH
ncbi:hypothetical protein D3C72_2188560 [compost metagenome]